MTTQVTDEEVEAAARTLDPVAFFSRQEVLDSDECNCGECDRWREIRREAALTNARAALQAAAEVRERSECAVLDSYPVENQRSHNERLRAALDHIASLPDARADEAATVARNTLNDGTRSPPQSAEPDDGPDVLGETPSKP